MTKPATTFDQAVELLAKPVPAKFVKTKPGKSKASYISHAVIRQYLHYVFDDHTFETVDVHEYDIPKTKTVGSEKVNYTVRKVAMKVALHVHLNGEARTYFGWGESDNLDNPYKSAESDAVKRIAAMSFGLGLNLWAGSHYFLPEKLTKALSEATEQVPEKAEYGGDGDETHAAEDGGEDEVAAKRDQKADNPPAPKSDDELATRFRLRFHAILTELGVPDDHKKIWLRDKQNVESTNDLTDATKRGILKKLDEDGGKLQLLKGIRASVSASGDGVDVSRYDETIETLSEAA